MPSSLYAYADNRSSGYSVTLNGEVISPEIINGYLTIDRPWSSGDKVQLKLDMPTRLVKACEEVEADRGLLAVERGPLVYCAEWPDNTVPVDEIGITESTEFTPVWRDDLPGGLMALKADNFTLIPYYAWAHRGPGKMRVWLNNAYSE